MRFHRFELLGMVFSPTELAGLSALLLTCTIVFWRGGGTERRIALVVAIAWIGSLIIDDDRWHGVQWGIFAIDVILAIWLVTEALFSRRLWIAFAASAQIMIVLTHIVFAVNASMIQEGFFSAYYLWSYVVLFTLVVGSVFYKPTKATNLDPPAERVTDNS